MKIAILSDLHANRYALQAALEDSEEQGAEEYWVLGDVVGYGPHPVPPLLFLKRYVRPDAWVIGNHDAMLADLLTPEDGEEGLKVQISKGQGRKLDVRGRFLTPDEWYVTGSAPVEAILLNRQNLRKHPEADAFWKEAFTLERAKPKRISLDGIECILVHASQTNPLSKYIYAWNVEIHLPAEFDAIEEMLPANPDKIRIQFFGHTHVPTFVRSYIQNGQRYIVTEKIWPGQQIKLEETYLYLINPGSIGQPRDGIPAPSYVIFDTVEKAITFRRIPYNYTYTAQDLMAEGYPDSLIRRLRDATPANETPEEWKRHYQEVKAQIFGKRS